MEQTVVTGTRDLNTLSLGYKGHDLQGLLLLKILAKTGVRSKGELDKQGPNKGQGNLIVINKPTKNLEKPWFKECYVL